MRKSLYTQTQISLKHIQENPGNACKNKINSSYKTLFDSISLRPSILLGVFLLSSIAFIFGGCSRDTSKEDLELINGRLEQLENKITQLDAQFTETNRLYDRKFGNLWHRAGGFGYS